MSDGDRRLIASIPAALAATHRVCASVNVASTRAGINMDAVLLMAQTVLADRGRDSGPGQHRLRQARRLREHGRGQSVHGRRCPRNRRARCRHQRRHFRAGCRARVVSSLPQDADLTAIAEAIKATAFKITRVGELVAREAAASSASDRGIVDLSLRPTPAEGTPLPRSSRRWASGAVAGRVPRRRSLFSTTP
jgi:uncharacterized protein